MDKSVNNYSSNLPRAIWLSPFIGAGANGTLTDTPAPATALWAYPYIIELGYRSVV